ncbi:TGS domain-containing protein, partial [Patescibacteria group bacterium]|nr:TGS domain-containing protein [Patescibacteria group bacterium]
GIYRLKVRLEDLSFKYTQLEDYENLNKQLRAFGKKHDKVINRLIGRLKSFADDRDYPDVEVMGRVKSIYSIYKKLKKKGLSTVDDLFDIFAIRLIFPSKYKNDEEFFDHLYAFLGLLHSNWQPISRKFKDYIAVPKPNGYRSLHTVVTGLFSEDESDDRPVEIQIRSEDMHTEAEYGFASHWLYKQHGSNKTEDSLKSQVDWLKGFERVKEQLDEDSAVMQQVEVDVFKDRIFVLTPRGEVKDLPRGATPLDFAYLIHSELGNHCMMVKVNGEVVSFGCELQNGDVVSIITRRDVTPKLQWLSLVKTQHAKNKIRFWFNQLDRENHLREGKLLINKQLEKMQMPSLDATYSILKNFGGQKLTVVQRENLVEQVGKGYKASIDIIRNSFPKSRTRKEKMLPVEYENLNKKEVDPKELIEKILVGGEDYLPLKLGACCSPNYGDSIIGYVTRGNSVTIHKRGCSVMDKHDKKRVIDASWKGAQKSVDVLKKGFFEVSAMPRLGLIRDMSLILATAGIDISEMSTELTSPNNHKFFFEVTYQDEDKFERAVADIEKVDNVIGLVVKEF